MRAKTLPALLAAATALPESAPANPPIRPSAESARQNAFLIFNSVHSAMRQWGSSLHHNGMALIPATIPRGTVLFHGSHSNSTPAPPEWLAFEMEHAENFARSHPYFRHSSPSSSNPHPNTNPNPDPESHQFQHPLNPPPQPEPEPPTIGNTTRGYLHTFLTTRPINLLYIDGSAAAKTTVGTLDTQDYLLRLHDPNKTYPHDGDFLRAAEICDVVRGWGYDGVVRMEIGFEVVWCRGFGGGEGEGGEGGDEGLERTSVTRSMGLENGGWDRKGGWEGVWRWVRAVGERYDGIGGGRVQLDFSRMVSGLWYPVNVTNPDEKRVAERLPRLAGATSEEREAMWARVAELAKRGDGEEEEERVDWQGVVDMVVSRYGQRLGYMASEGIEDERFLREVFAATNAFFDYAPSLGDVTFAAMNKERVKEARRRCAAQHLFPVEWRRGKWTEEDEMLYVAISHVTERICETFFDIRVTLEEVQSAVTTMQDAVRLGQKTVGELMAELRWTTWKKCRGCAVDEVCFVAMWPFGRTVDHDSPGCLKQEVFESIEFREESYWDLWLR